MAGNGETEGPIDGFADANARGHEGLRDEESVTANLKRRGRICEVQSVKRGTNDGERLAKSAGAGGKLAGEAIGERAIPYYAAIAGHLLEIFKSMIPANDLEFRYGVNAPTVRIEGLTLGGR